MMRMINNTQSWMVSWKCSITGFSWHPHPAQNPSMASPMEVIWTTTNTKTTQIILDEYFHLKYDELCLYVCCMASPTELISTTSQIQQSDTLVLALWNYLYLEIYSHTNFMGIDFSDLKYENNKSYVPFISDKSYVKFKCENHGSHFRLISSEIWIW